MFNKVIHKIFIFWHNCRSPFSAETVQLFLWIWIAGNGSVSKIWLEPSFRACSLFWWDTVTERLITDAFCGTLFPSWSRSIRSHDTFIVFDLIDFAICQWILKWVRMGSRSGFSMTCSRTPSRNHRTDRTQDVIIPKWICFRANIGPDGLNQGSIVRRNPCRPGSLSPSLPSL